MLLHGKPTKIRSLSNVINVHGAFSTSVQGFERAFLLLDDESITNQPQKLGFSLDDFTYTGLVQSSTHSGCSAHGKLVQSHMVKTGFNPCLFLQNTLLHMYLKCNESDLALQLFDEMPERDVVSWTSLISGYTRLGRYWTAIEIFCEARIAKVNLNKFTYASMLSICAQTSDLELGKVIHGLIISSGVGINAFLTSALVAMYSKCAKVDQARLAFDTRDELGDVSWSSMISGYVKAGLHDEMLEVLVKMHRHGVRFSGHVLGSVLSACCSNFNRSLLWGKLLHSCSLKLGWDLNHVVGTALLDMYAKIGDLDDAILLFSLLRNKSVVMYTAMIAGLFRGENVSDEFAKKALNLFPEMQRYGLRPSEYTFSTMIKGCIECKDFEYGKQIHAHICKNDLQSNEYIGAVLLNMYLKCNEWDLALQLFDEMPKGGVVSWTSLISGYAQNGEYEQALILFRELFDSGLKPNAVTISIVLSACANLAAAQSGEQIKCYSIKSGIDKSSVVQTSLIYMYAKSGDIHSANRMFEVADKSDTVSWTAMLFSRAHHGCANEALNLFELMIASGIAPDDMAFVGVLTACSHGGLVEEGLRYYESMKRDHGIKPNEKHSACIVDLLGRAGRLSDAKSFIIHSGFSNASIMWLPLLRSCRIHKNTKIGIQAAERFIELEPQASSSYRLLYNIYDDAGMHAEAKKIRDLMTNQRIKKEPGLSKIEVGNGVLSFLVGDISHPKSEKIWWPGIGTE